MFTGHRVPLVSRVLKACEPGRDGDPVSVGYAPVIPLRRSNSGQTTGS